MGDNDNLFLYLSSEDYHEFHVNNNSISFVTELASNIELNENWECALLECVCKLSPGFKYGDYIDVVSDIIQPSAKYDGGTSLLRRFVLGKQNISPKNYTILEEKLVDERFLPIRNYYMKQIKIEIKTNSKTGHILVGQSSPSFIVLQLRQK